jgi:hypothetical protein
VGGWGNYLVILCDPGHSFCCTEGFFDRSVSVCNPKIKLGSKLIDHRPNKLKGVSSEVLVYLGNFLRRMLLLIMLELVGRHGTLYRLVVLCFRLFFP